MSYRQHLMETMKVADVLWQIAPQMAAEKQAELDTQRARIEFNLDWEDAICEDRVRSLRKPVVIELDDIPF